MIDATLAATAVLVLLALSLLGVAFGLSRCEGLWIVLNALAQPEW